MHVDRDETDMLEVITAKLKRNVYNIKKMLVLLQVLCTYMLGIIQTKRFSFMRLNDNLFLT